jgi:hypothetical protein
MTERSEDTVFKERVRYYAEILNPLFDSSLFMTTDALFEFVCVLVRPSGIMGPEWDPWYESQDILDDLGNLATLDLPTALFPDPARTRVRLSLLSYCHLTEMDFPYALVANLLRIRLKLKYHVAPFGDLYTAVDKKNPSPLQRMRPPSPRKKLDRIKKLADGAKLGGVSHAFESIYDRAVRNAVYHSDYTLSHGQLRLLGDFHLSKTKGYSSPVIEWDELAELFTNTFAFHTALFSLYDRCRKSFGDFVNAFVPYDGHYKGVLQLVFDDEQRLMGFRVYWPNGTLGQHSRTKDGSIGVNTRFDPDGSVNFMVGLYASNRSAFSPLVESGQEPVYSIIPGTTCRPHWPEDLKVYKLNL